MGRHIFVLSAAVGLAVATVVAGPWGAQAAGPRPAFQLPFPCGDQWRIDSWDAEHQPGLDMVKEPWPSVPTEGSLLVAPAAGRVNQSFVHSNAGNLIQINHGDGWFTTYIHLQSRAVSVGEQVSQGETIGRVGHTGRTSNGVSHLHFEQAVDSTGDGSATWGFEGAERVTSVFNGVQYGNAAGQTYRMVTSRNCGEPEPPPPPKLAPALLKAQADGTAAVWRWSSDGGAFDRLSGWGSSGTYSVDLVGDRVAAGDVDRDGKDDLVAVKQNPDGTFAIQVWGNAAQGPETWFTSQGTYDLAASAGGRLVVGDWTGDGRAEPALLKSESDGRATILRWVSTGGRFDRADTDWVSGGTYTLSLVGDRVAAGDANGDGRDDLVAVKQEPDGTFVIQAWGNAVHSPETWYQSDGTASLNATVHGRLALGTW